MVELTIRTACDNVLTVKPYLVPGFECRGWGTMLVRGFLVSGLGPGHLGSKVVGYVPKVLSGIHSGSVPVSGRDILGLGKVELPGRVITEVREEWRHARGLRGVIVCGEFGKGQIFFPVVLKVVDVGSKVLFHDRVKPLRLTIDWRVVRC